MVFCAVNVAGAVMAAMMREPVHAASHIALLVAGVYGLRFIWYMGESSRQDVMQPAELDGKLTHLEVSLQGVAMSVERMGEGQREINDFFARVDGREARAVGTRGADRPRIQDE